MKEYEEIKFQAQHYSSGFIRTSNVTSGLISLTSG
jgi:hypothetical protein